MPWGLRFKIGLKAPEPGLPPLSTAVIRGAGQPVGAVVVLGVWLPMGPLAGYFKLQALPTAFFPWLAGILLAYALLITGMKRLYLPRYGWQ